jgi:acyl carrier protein
MDREFLAMLRPYLKYVGDREVQPEASLRELGLDSMNAIELLFALEDRYGIVVPDERLNDATFESPLSLWSVVEELRPAAAEAS